jgi:hypothetical protein
VPALRIEGYVIVSADGKLANARNVMPDELKFEGDKRFFTAALDRADLILHGRNSHEDQPDSPRRKRLVLTRKIAATAPDPSNPNAILWNPAGSSFEAACAEDASASCRTGTGVAEAGGSVERDWRLAPTVRRRANRCRRGRASLRRSDSEAILAGGVAR